MRAFRVSDKCWYLKADPIDATFADPTSNNPTLHLAYITIISEFLFISITSMLSFS